MPAGASPLGRGWADPGCRCCASPTASAPFRWRRPRTSSLAAPGHPVAPRAGDVIEGLDRAREVPGASAYCAGVAQEPSTGRLVTAGGRVLAVAGMPGEQEKARRVAYEAITHISWPGMQYRH